MLWHPAEYAMTKDVVELFAYEGEVGQISLVKLYIREAQGSDASFAVIDVTLRKVNAEKMGVWKTYC